MPILFFIRLGDVFMPPGLIVRTLISLHGTAGMFGVELLSWLCIMVIVAPFFLRLRDGRLAVPPHLRELRRTVGWIAAVIAVGISFRMFLDHLKNLV